MKHLLKTLPLVTVVATLLGDVQSLSTNQTQRRLNIVGVKSEIRISKSETNPKFKNSNDQNRKTAKNRTTRLFHRPANVTMLMLAYHPVLWLH